MRINGKRPNFLIITTDEERFPPPYENEEAKKFRLATAQAVAAMKAQGMEFLQHHAAATACAPSRTTIYTGQYPSLHGVSQTPGIGKSSFDQNMFWLEPFTVPTLGNYFRQGGYRTYYHGKWHISYEDIDVPGSQSPLLSNSITGEPYPDKIRLYAEANRLNQYGFDGWIGPEPHGSLMANSGTIRDPGYARQVCATLAELDKQARAGKDAGPFLMVASFVNPHDIVFSDLWSRFETFEAAWESGKLPQVDPAPTMGEALDSKPRAQKDYGYVYPRMYLPQPNTEKYRQFYYFLQAEVGRYINEVYAALQNTCFADDTIVVYTSDHGEMLGAHGGLHQKWYVAYEEVLHVPLIISNKHLFSQGGQTTEVPTSHVDLMPTLLGLADIDADAARQALASNHTEAHPLVGRNLAGFLEGRETLAPAPIYFMTDDNVEVGSQQRVAQVVQPKHLETVITTLPETGATRWKYTRYFDNPRFYQGQVGNPDDLATQRLIPDEFECYNLDADPLETRNLLSPLAPEPLPENLRAALEAVMAEQRRQKRLQPTNRNNPSDMPGPPLPMVR